ncbi:MAG: transcriptional repressor, partial [Cyclobacteriaceae bacterium]|nr:transcriptional repressor [Cyclobacteriaceae bacterium HetDA_MAG_MS6]
MIQIDYQQVKEELAKVGLKATHPRIVVFSELMSSHVHPTADQLFERIKNSHPSIAKGTVYRVLDHLVEAGVVYQVASKDGIKR